MNDSYHVCILSPRHGRGHLTFFDEPFGEQTPFEWAGGYSVAYENGFIEGGVVTPDDLALGLDAWLARHQWRPYDLEAIIEV
jgi:hypothetical protein